MGVIRWMMNTIQGKTKKYLPLDVSGAKPKVKIFATDKESQNNKIETWNNNQDVISGMQFCATMQLRTPLRVLLRHGEVHSDINSKPPKIATEMWEGSWIAKTKTFRELGIDMDEPVSGTMASSVGQIPSDGGEYLKFLIAVRKIVESHDSIESRSRQLNEIPIPTEWKIYLDKLWGMSHIIKTFFPRFIDTIPKINATTIEELSSLGLDTPNSIATAPDESLLSINGIGQAKLKTIRDYCADITNNRDTKRIDNVTR
tara:strand:+ start:1876 stop:2649 length:774 start_codon:yes stop_codon:yes gene_type:complete